MDNKRAVKPLESTGVNLEVLFGKFYQMKSASGRSRATLKSYRESFDRFFKFLGQPAICNEMNEYVVFDFIDYLKQEHWADASINHYIRDIRSFRITV